MNRLFVRVFLGFWLTTLLTLVLGQQVAQYLSREVPRQNAVREQHEQAREFIREFSRRYHRQSELEWLSWLQSQNTDFDWLLHRPAADDIGHRLNIDSEIAALLNDPFQGHSPRPHRTKNGLIHIKRLGVRDPNQKAYLIIRVKRPNAFLVAMFQQHLWLRLLIALLATGALSYWMVKRYTRPIVALRAATQALANGDLSVRLEETDSVDDLNALRHDFNRMAEQLQAAQTRQRSLIHDVSHELRTPLARIQAALALATRRQGESDELARIAQESDYLNRLIDQLLQGPEQDIDLSDTLDLWEFLTQILKANELEAQGRSISLELEGDRLDLWLQSDSKALRMAIENVLRNAIRHSPNNNRVSLSLKLEDDGDIAIRVRDRGTGVPSKELENLFLPFYRLDQSRQRGSGGHGLGLAICKRVIGNHGGSVQARNCEPGLELEMRLPASLRVLPPSN